ncbi:DNA-binding transcriptional regulator, LysR family [Cupriavidus necator]|uniref:LysR family transcriptional regulator n=1 Tax=Cupriavidus necator (strain ATCC 17699 / DSM 428 / KCTC 22496 / NCIMB 10442 / H16 / Stanier 337) TaxID=381666 RepID=Q0K2L0_CUPNH|nr:LysR family transcriptional regulator [Cupriavidus necator]QCC03652.1 LysR family transcriptional regulator [Cupriavidus necator H16]QQB80708.1 LysR family transcriptional regulator [Cupriavidus necator]WKA45001.1 LysR family transcriptional regulator [Cupriavidus necator]CAJ95764.1 transcriptional regulator, LysR-family [Cupriavidus necator H16]
MRVSLRLLRYFAAAAETGSTTAAARLLNVSQPSISVAIRELETLFEEALFSRDVGARMTLTRFGVRKLAEARHILGAATAFEVDKSGDAAAGEVQIGVFRTLAPVYLPVVLRLARERYPKLSVRFVEGDLAQLEDWLHGGQIELALTYDVGMPEDIERELLAELRPYGLLPAGSRLARRKGSLSLHELAQEPLILIDLPHSREFLMAPFWQFGLQPEVRYRATSLELARGMVANGLGAALLITQAPASSQITAVVEKPIREDTVRQPLVIARTARATRTRASELLAECVRAAVEEAKIRRA